MKYIKTFERVESYEAGDYMLINDDVIKMYEANDGNLYRYCRIIERSNAAFDTEVIYDDRIRKLYLWLKDFQRKLTPYEIENFEIKKESLKYNL